MDAHGRVAPIYLILGEITCVRRRETRLRRKAEELGLPMVRLAMAWAMTHPDVTAVLIGARSTEHIDNAVAAFEMRMDPELRAEMSGWRQEPALEPGGP